MKTNHWRRISLVIVFVTVFFNVWVGVCSLNVVFCECQCVESAAALVSVYVMWGNCLKCYSEIIKISAISIDTRYKPWNYGFAFRGVQGGGRDGAAPAEGGDDWVPVRLCHFSGFLPINDAQS